MTVIDIPGLILSALTGTAAGILIVLMVREGLKKQSQGDQFRRSVQDIDPTRYRPHPTNASTAPKTELFDLDGVSWHDAPIPPRWHRCWPQTSGVVNYFTTVERCACGAINFDAARQGSDYWMRRNDRRHRKT